ncbi:FG-GAP repeat domain-containing protein [Engelhardtia mirabilis]|uniref:FG-GAP repeat protein n=1 Tax=Engelhardtia mirabilis TaxID=2528011 RepID=A0A518BSB4_9BACT|nr:FG-GAP repeat protein [Planctomycetes bacterium Pla133]QDV04184.1 FG-GAP repeat protein [Planctomycetes bacterium Pla86]
MKPQHLPSLWAASVAVVLVGSSAATQSFPAKFSPDPVTDWEGVHGGHESAVELLAGDFDSDGRVDAVARTSEGRAFLVDSVGTRQGRTTLYELTGGGSEHVADMALLASSGPGDALLSAGTGGILHWRWSATVDALLPTGITAPGEAYSRVAVGNPVPSNYRIAYGLKEDLRTVVPLIFLGGSGNFFAAMPGFNLPEWANAIAAVDLDGDGLAELAAVGDFGLRIRNYLGLVVADYPRGVASVAPDALAVLVDQGTTGEQLAWLAQPAGGAELWTVGQGFIRADADPAVDQVLAMDSGDLDGDGRADLAFVDSAEGALYLLRATTTGASAPRYSVAGGGSLRLVATPVGFAPIQTALAAGAAVVDLDNDGDADLIEFRSDTDRAEFVIERGDGVEASNRAPMLDPGGSGAWALGGSGDYRVQLEFDPPAVSAGGDEVLLRLWHRPSEGLSRVAPTPSIEVTVPANSWPLQLQYDLQIGAAEHPVWYAEFCLADSTTGELLPAGMSVVAASYFTSVAFQSLPGSTLWGGPAPSFGASTVGSSGTGPVPRVPPPPPPPAPPDPTPVNP